MAFQLDVYQNYLKGLLNTDHRVSDSLGLWVHVPGREFALLTRLVGMVKLPLTLGGKLL